jgi:F-type H+-transporting ATPase subunit delta
MSGEGAGYAAAFLEVAKTEGAISAVGDELATFSQAFESSPELQKTLTDTSLPVDRRMLVISNLLGAKASPVTVNLLSLLVGAGRAKEIPATVNSFLQQSASANDQQSGSVRSAYPLSDDQKAALTAAVVRSVGKHIHLTFVVDPTVLGGVVTTIGDTVIDGTVRNRLEQLKAAV